MMWMKRKRSHRPVVFAIVPVLGEAFRSGAYLVPPALVSAGRDVAEGAVEGGMRWG